jgi:uncharacterized protein
MTTQESRAAVPVSPTERGRVAVTGTGRVQRAADIALVTFVAEGIGPTASEARSIAAGIASAVGDALAGAGVAAPDLRTAGVDVSPTWDHEGNQPVRTGFIVSNRIAAVVRDLERVGAVLDAALEAGATGLDGVTFQLADASADTTEARRLAVADARDRATTIATASASSLGRLVAITEGGSPIPSPRGELRLTALAAGDAFSPTPVMPGTIDVSVSVTAEWELLEHTPG